MLFYNTVKTAIEEVGFLMPNTAKQCHYTDHVGVSIAVEKVKVV